MASSIFPLPAEAIAQLTSSSKINSLKDVILGLLRNALDAKATIIDVTVDYRRGGCSIEDNGLGILPAEFHATGGLGKKHHTSKYEIPSPVYGRQGLFLWSLASLSLVTITSHHHLHRSHNSLTLHQSSVIARLIPSPAHQRLSFQSHGTRVTVRDLFGNLPVRRKSQYLADISNGERSKEWELLRKGIVGLLLAWGGAVEVTVRDMEHDRKMVFRHPKHCQSVKDRSDMSSSLSTTLPTLTQSLFGQASYVPVQPCKSWVSISGSSSSLAINGAICLEPAPTKQFQFMSVGIEPIFAQAGNNVLFDEINRLFSASTFGNLEDNNFAIDETPQKVHVNDSPRPNQKYNGKHLRQQRKGVDRWPMFFLKIDSDSNARHDIERENSLVEDGDLKAVLDLLQILIRRFLEEYSCTAHARKPSRVTRLEESPENSTPPFDYETRISSTPSSRRKDMACPLPGKTLELGSESLEDGEQPLRRRHPNIRIRPRFEVDDLGGGVNFPRLENNRVCHPDADFGTWSRMKSAKSGGYDNFGGTTYKPLNRGERAAGPGINVLTANNRLLRDTSSRGLQHCEERTAAEIYEATPRNGVEIPQTNPGQSLSLVQKSCPDSNAVPDSEIHWLNPNTKTPFCFNARTGFIVPPAPLRPKAAPSSYGGISMNTTNDGCRPSTAAGAQETELRSGDWIQGILADWKNPVFPPTEEPIPQLSTRAYESRPVLSDAYIEKPGESCRPGLASRISRDALRKAKVIAQVDKKFILARLNVQQQPDRGSEMAAGMMPVLILIDQHAADERCRVETLLSELCIPSTHEIDTPRSNLGLRSSLNTVVLDKPFSLQVDELEYPLYQEYAAHFARWGILYDLPSIDRHPRDRSETTNMMFVKTLPPGVAEKCRAEPQLLVKLLREEIWHQRECGSRAKGFRGSKMDCSLPADHLSSISDSRSTGNEHRWLRELSNCPRLLLDMLNSRACRRAIMFNDELSLEDCQALMTRLAGCAFPFQCAHGRLSMVPLVDFNRLAGSSESSSIQYDSSLGFGLRGKTTLENFKGDKSFVEKFREWSDTERALDLDGEEDM